MSARITRVTDKMLFDLGSVPKSSRVSHKAECEALKAKWWIQTNCDVRRCADKAHVMRVSRNWMALSMPLACRLLKGHDLTDEQKTNLGALMAGYCRLLDDANLIADGYPTEFDAVKAAALIAERYNK